MKLSGRIIQFNLCHGKYFKLIIDYISISESYENIYMFDIIKGNVKDQINIKITNDKVEDLYQNNLLYSILTNCVNISNDILVEIEYPCNKFEQILKLLSDVKAQNERKMKISVTTNHKSYFEHKNELNKYINICNIGKSIDTFPEKSFENFTSLTHFKISEKVTTIGNYSFRKHSSLTEIIIPTSVKSIDVDCFQGCSKIERITINPFYTQIKCNPC